MRTKLLFGISMHVFTIQNCITLLATVQCRPLGAYHRLSVFFSVFQYHSIHKLIDQMGLSRDRDCSIEQPNVVNMPLTI